MKLSKTVEVIKKMSNKIIDKAQKSLEAAEEMKKLFEGEPNHAIRIDCSKR